MEEQERGTTLLEGLEERFRRLIIFSNDDEDEGRKPVKVSHQDRNGRGSNYYYCGNKGNSRKVKVMTSTSSSGHSLLSSSGSPSRSHLAPSLEAELRRIMLKEIGKVSWEDNSDLVLMLRSSFGEAIAHYHKSFIPEKGCSGNEDDELVLDAVSNSLTVLRLITEYAVSGSRPRNEDSFVFWAQVVEPNLPAVFDYLSGGVLGFCHGRLYEKANNSAGFLRHQLIGLIQKVLKTLLVILKPVLVHIGKTDGGKQQLPYLLSMGKTVLTLLRNDGQDQLDLGLDITCSMGLVVVYIVSLLLSLQDSSPSGQVKVIQYFEQVFDEALEPSKVQKSSCRGEEVATFLQDLTHALTSKDVNMLGLANGLLCFYELGRTPEQDEQLTNLIFKSTKFALNIDHGTMEALNLGTARCLEALVQKLACPSVSASLIRHISPLFPSIEFFVFSYIPGHIDAVKNCCRSILGYLSRIYERINSDGGSGDKELDLVEELLRRVLSKEAHVKWLGLSHVAKSSSESIKILRLDKNIPVSLLCVQRFHRNPAIECYVAFMSYDFPLVDRQTWEERWLSPLFATQPCQNNEANWPQKKGIIAAILNSEKTIPNLQVMVKPLMQFIIRKMNCMDEEESQNQFGVESTLLAADAIKIASECGLKNLDLEVTTKASMSSSFRGLVPREMLNSWLWHENPQIRLAGFSLLVETKKTSEIFLPEDFNSLKILLKYNLVNQNPAFRQQFISYFKKMLVRLKDGISILTRKRETESVEEYKSFLKWLWDFFVEREGLFCGANFARRCQSLECLHELLLIFDNTPMLGIVESDDNLRLLTWLIDSYENNKVRALDILVKLPIPSFQNEEFCNRIFNQALSLCESVKPPDSVTGRYLMILLMKKATSSKYSSPMSLLNFLYDKLVETYDAILSTSLTQVSCERPMYGLIRCIKMVLNESSSKLARGGEECHEYFNKLIPLLLKYDQVIFPLLGNAAPEGFLPGLPDADETNSHVVRSITAQMVLVCSWRSMRDICLLLSDMCACLPLEGEGQEGHVISCRDVSLIGDHMLNLMKNLVHRGVFEQVFVAFKTLAGRLWKSPNKELCQLPSKWLSEAMDEEHMSAMSITRRSAGLPFIFQALLSAEAENSSFLSIWIQRLFISSEIVHVRIHSMNVLRGLFRDANFSKAMMPFVPEGLRAAFRGLKSEDWNERNAGLMLYGAVMRRAFGPKLNTMNAPSFFRRFPQMYDFLSGELDVCLSSMKNKEGHNNGNALDFTFHLLLLLSSFSSAGRVEDEHFRLSELLLKIRQCGSSPDIDVRKLSAKALVPFLPSPSDAATMVSTILQDILKSKRPGSTQNQLHGNLCQIAAVVKHLTALDNARKESIVPDMDKLFPFLSSIRLCPTAFQAAAEILIAFDDYSNPTLRKMFESLSTSFGASFKLAFSVKKEVPGFFSAEKTITRSSLLFKLSSEDDVAKKHDILINILSKECSSDFDNVPIEQLVELLDEDGSLLQKLLDFETTFKNELKTPRLLETLMQCFCSYKPLYFGQSSTELSFLSLLSSLLDHGVARPILENEDGFLEKLFNLCDNRLSATNEHKRLALTVISKAWFGCNMKGSGDYLDQFCNILVDWSDSSMDDDLRYGAVSSLPPDFLSSIRGLSVLNQCKMWLTIFNLAQDDDLTLRTVLNSKLLPTEVNKKSPPPVCDRKSLEMLVSLFFQTVLEAHPLEGLTLLMGLLLRDDFEIKTEEAHDDDEGRLFDKSEMNMFNEIVILARIVSQELESQPLLLNRLTPCWNKTLPMELVELYEVSSKSKVFVCSPTIATLFEMVKMRLKYDADEDDDDSDCSRNSTENDVVKALSSSSQFGGGKVQRQVVHLIDRVFLKPSI